MSSKLQRAIQKIAFRLLGTVDHWAYMQYFDYPFGRSPWAKADKYMELWNNAKRLEYPTVNQFEKKCGYDIDKDWFHELALLTQISIKKSDICYQHGRLLYSALRNYIAQNNNNNVNILETGTARGFSSLCMAKALKDANKPGKIVTFDILPHHVKMYWNCIADEESPTSRAELLSNYQSLTDEYIIFVQGTSQLQLRKVQNSRIHFAFLDGMHTYENVLNEFYSIQDKQKKGDIIFFDDYTPGFFPGVVKAVDEICRKYNYSKEMITVSEQRNYVVALKN